ncbi:MAG TPA: hypothetical protein VD866_17700 [Urbifossiella sp.]|nr:hypothetical protein [Urbifossiella sp.]
MPIRTWTEEVYIECDDRHLAASIAAHHGLYQPDLVQISASVHQQSIQARQTVLALPPAAPRSVNRLPTYDFERVS